MSGAPGAVRELPRLTTPDGRTLTWCETGPEGAPVGGLYLHGTGSSRLEVALYAEAAQARGVRLVAWDRPGHGGSTPQPGRTIRDVVADTRTVAAAAGVERPAVFGVSGGGSHVLVLAATAPDVVRRGVAINPGPPSDDAVLALLGDRIAGLIRMARDRPRPFGVLAGVLQGTNPVARALQRRQAHPMDRAIVFESPLRPRFEAAAEQGRRQKGAWLGEARMFWGAPWQVDLGRFAVPLDVFTGEDDEFRPFAESLAASGARLHTFPGGHLSGFTERTMADVLAAVTADR